MRFILLMFFVSSIMLSTSCKESEQDNTKVEERNKFYSSAKPGVRWWWFATEIKKEDIKHQLDWAKRKNFGAVEIAWVYPLHRYQRMYARKYNRFYGIDTSAQKWLSEEWTESVAYAKEYADSIELVCDFTFGSAWPAAGHNIDYAHTTKIYGDTTFRQTLTFSWAWPDTFLVIDHLDKEAFQQFAKPIAQALKPALKGSKSALFTDSWEIKLNSQNKVWTDGFEEYFFKRFKYDIIPYMEKGLDSFPDVRYDYMMMLDTLVRSGFYEPFVEQCKDLGAFSRVQCLASPTDVMTTYSMVDIPETESMLNNPNYSRIVSSSACLSSKYMVSSESFTCMYGFPATFLRKEQTADLKMVADAMFAKGVNQHFYHGMPYNPKGVDSIDFFATTYFGPGSSLENDLADFNQYVEKVSALMQEGETYSNVAVYIPFEDGIMAGAYPPERQRVWVWGQYEMRYIQPPKELEGFHPLWINRHFLEQAEFLNGKLRVGDAAFKLLYIDVDYMDYRALKRIAELAELGLPIVLKSSSLKEPAKTKTDAYPKLLKELESYANVVRQLSEVSQIKPLVTGDNLPAYWCRIKPDGTHLIFLAQPKAKNLQYPIYSGQSFMDKSEERELSFHINGNTTKKTVLFKPYQSVVMKLWPDGRVEEVDISFRPKDPVIRPKEKQKLYF
ncbi:MAG: glycosyl hydrolase [Vicingaceae bacterium]